MFPNPSDPTQRAVLALLGVVLICPVVLASYRCGAALLAGLRRLADALAFVPPSTPGPQPPFLRAEDCEPALARPRSLSPEEHYGRSA